MTGGPAVVRHIVRADSALVEELSKAGAATVHEAAWRTGLLAPNLRPIYPGARVAGTAVTVLCPAGDNLMIHLAIELCRPGDVLVVALASECTDGLVGELIATSLRAHGVRGVVVDAGVRDVAELRRMDFPVWSRAVSAQGTTKRAAGWVNVPVVCGGQLVQPGAVVVADDDGVVCVPAELAPEVAKRCRARVEREHAMRERLVGGELSADINDLRAVARELGVEYVDGSGPDD
ncbi:MAG: 4-carboxy-4-hydroxy-2-oxoadipate aldolase/oxaloacetate decarboxylase [Streptosporangiales bacterium]|nr:4-carboxy-4-hydroxy-2-oxoadipate aldolase/oxaloacetate decarboxylase [Streptosporangiales bacterium]